MVYFVFYAAFFVRPPQGYSFIISRYSAYWSLPLVSDHSRCYDHKPCNAVPSFLIAGTSDLESRPSFYQSTVISVYIYL